MKDMIKLEKLKKIIFWDYDKAEKIIENLKDKQNGKFPRHDIKTKKLDKNLARADDSLMPLSYSGITDPQREITYVNDLM